MVAIHQFLHSLVYHDAISTHTRHLHKLLQEMDIESNIYAGEQRAGKGAATYFRDFAPTTKPEDTWILYHLSTATPLTAYLQDRPERLAVDYHNITPSEYFAPWEPTIGNELSNARSQFESLAGRTRASLADSFFNATELRDARYPTPAVAPILFDPDDFTEELDAKLDASLQADKAKGGADWLFVGRIAPNKCQHDIIKAFALYCRLYDSNSRLHLVGGISSHRYWTTLHDYAKALDIADRVTFAGGVSNGELGAYYKNADVFVCLSEHEGFGVPLLEAMHHEIPVVAHAAAAVPETVANGGILLADKSPSMVAAAVDRVVRDRALATAMVAAATQRLAAMSLNNGKKIWREAIEALVAR